jgi:peroxiredoxin Q/BCP
MKRPLAALLLAASLGAALVLPAAAQNPTPPPPPDLLEVGQMAPDIELAGATRYGVMQAPVRLSDYRGEVVVLAFFFRARTRG